MTRVQAPHSNRGIESAPGAERLLSAAKWSVCASAVLAAHAAALWMMTHWVTPSGASAAPDQPIMIELAPAPVDAASADPPPEPEAETEEAKAEPQVNPPKTSEPPAEPSPSPEPMNETPPAESSRAPDPPPPPVAEAEAVLPPPAPKAFQKAPAQKREAKKPVAPKVEPRPRPVARQKSAPAAVPAPRTPSAISAGMPAASAASRSNWQSEVAAHLNRFKRSSATGATGTARVAFRINARGQVLSVSLAGSSGDPGLDQEAVALVRRASPVPAPPPGMGAGLSLAVPVRFTR